MYTVYYIGIAWRPWQESGPGAFELNAERKASVFFKSFQGLHLLGGDAPKGQGGAFRAFRAHGVA